MFDLPEKLALGFISGVAFGFLLQKGRVAKFHVIVGQFLLKDWTVLKVMLTAVAVGAVLFGAGMAIFGYCPGTSVAACGEGRRDAMVGVLGMLAGALAYVAAFPALQGLIKGFGDWGEVTLPALTGLSPWLFVGALALVALLLRAFAGRQPTIQH